MEDFLIKCNEADKYKTIEFEIAHLVCPTTLTMNTGLDNIVCTY